MTQKWLMRQKLLSGGKELIYLILKIVKILLQMTQFFLHTCIIHAYYYNMSFDIAVKQDLSPLNYSDAMYSTWSFAWLPNSLEIFPCCTCTNVLPFIEIIHSVICENHENGFRRIQHYTISSLFGHTLLSVEEIVLCILTI